MLSKYIISGNGSKQYILCIYFPLSFSLQFICLCFDTCVRGEWESRSRFVPVIFQLQGLGLNNLVLSLHIKSQRKYVGRTEGGKEGGESKD